MKVMTFESYVAECGVTLPDDPGMHTRGNASDAAWNREMKMFTARSDAYIDRMIDLRASFRDAIERGEIREPTRMERLQLRASGHPDLKSTQAAKRILERNKTDDGS